jgi:hypothetical protein
VQRLGGGHTLVGLQNDGRVVEVDRGGRAVWSHRVRGRVHARRLPDGHTVISDRQKVYAVDAAGKVRWEYPEEGVVYLSAY